MSNIRPPVAPAMNSTESPDCESIFGCGGSWWEIIGPVIAFVFVFIILIASCKCIFEFCKRKYFSNNGRDNSRSSNRNRVRQGSTNANYVVEDLPPSYSSARLGRENVEIFSVVTEEDFIGTSATEEKLPSYLEIMEEKRKKNMASPQRHTGDELSVETERPHSVVGDVTAPEQNDAGDTGSLSETVTEPPPYYSSTSKL